MPSRKATPVANKGPGLRDRVKELRRVRAADIDGAPWNWRRHPQTQVEALAGSIEELGFFDPLDTRIADNGRLQLIDGHARRDLLHERIGPDTLIPCVVTDFTEAEARKAMLLKDPLAAMAEADTARLAALLRDVGTDSAAIGTMLEKLARSAGINPATIGTSGTGGDDPSDQDEEAGLCDEDDLDLLFKSPYPWFGGKARVAGAVWRRFGQVSNYIEPFFGSGAVFLNRPTAFAGNETINDLDGLVCNFWRAVQADPDQAAQWSDWPVNENDLHARHSWLIARKDSLQARLEGDPDHFDVKIAGWWCWGMACWIGAGFCKGDGPWQIALAEDGTHQLVHLGNEGQGVKRPLVHLSDEGQGVNRKRVHLSNEGQGVNRQLVHLGDEGKAGCGERGLRAWMRALAERLRRVRVCCGDWTRVCGGQGGDALSHFFAGGPTCAIFLDPPYADTAARSDDLYRMDSTQVAHAVRDWAIRHGDDPRLRIALCGYEGEHAMPTTWECLRWKAKGGYASVANGNSAAGQNVFRERLWFSPHCLRD
jgi:site-specific DNA-adenine methylase